MRISTAPPPALAAAPRNFFLVAENVQFSRDLSDIEGLPFIFRRAVNDSIFKIAGFTHDSNIENDHSHFQNHPPHFQNHHLEHEKHELTKQKNLSFKTSNTSQKTQT